MPTPILIVGAGPVGLVAAIELARRDVPVRIIDKLPEPTWQSRAVVVHARTLEAFARMGVVDAILAAGRKTTAMELHADGEPLGRVELGTAASPFPFSVTLAQDDTERVLTDRLASLGVTVERGRELTSFEQDEDGVQARLADGETIDAAWLIGTDGARSTIRHGLGLKLEGSFKGERFLLGDVEGDSPYAPEAMHSFFSPTAEPLLLFPMVGRRMRLIAQVPEGAPETLAQLQTIVDERAGGVTLDSSRWITTFEIHHAQVPRYRDGRVFLAGDAAHVHSPAGGQGMNLGIQDAFNLAWKLAMPEPSLALLDSYHAERHPVAAHVIRTTTVMTRTGTVRHPLARRLRNLGMRTATGLAPIAHMLVDETEGTRVAYHESPIVSGAGRHPRAGDVAPAPLSPTDDHEILELEDGRIAVVRPDGYLGLLAHDRAAVDAYFAALTSSSTTQAATSVG